MDLKQLEYFVRVAEMGGFTKAASMLAITQPALSHQVRQLEVELRQSLLYRNGRGVALTDAGKSLLTHARGILAHVKRAEEEVAHGRGTLVGHVTVGLPTGVARRLTLPLMKHFRSRYPNATCAIREGLSVDMVEGVITGRVDIAMIYNPVPSPAIDIAPLTELEMFLIAPRSDRGKGPLAPVPVRDLPNYPLISPSRPNANRAWIETEMAHHGLKPKIAIEVDGLAPTLDLVLGGYGYAILPMYLLWAHGFAAKLTAVPIVNPTLKVHMALITSAHRPATPLAQKVLAYMHRAGLELLTRTKFPYNPPSRSKSRALTRGRKN
jgi:LysR family nitrogen assimilation transcriptional regulator